MAQRPQLRLSQKFASSLPLLQQHPRFRAQTNVQRSVLAHAVQRSTAAPSARSHGRAAPSDAALDETVERRGIVPCAPRAAAPGAKARCERPSVLTSVPNRFNP